MSDLHAVGASWSVVVPTRDRPALLRRCLTALALTEGVERVELVVVNDSATPVGPLPPMPGWKIKVVQGRRQGPAAARNTGLLAATGVVIAFTDDDTIPDRRWLRTALDALERDSVALGVEGRTHCQDWNPLRAHSVRNEQPGAYWTCNIAYRRSALLAVDGFDEGFPFPHCEDLELGHRMAAMGKILYEPGMSLEHPPREITIGDLVRRGRLVESEWRLHRLLPRTTPPRWSWRTGPLVRLVRRWQVQVLSDLREGRVASAMAGVLIGLAQLLLALQVTIARSAGEDPVRSGLSRGAGVPGARGTPDPSYRGHLSPNPGESAAARAGGDASDRP